MSAVKLTYFAGRGRAEQIRLALHHAKIDFEDEKLSFEAWPVKRAELGDYFEFGQMPVLEIDGHKLS